LRVVFAGTPPFAARALEALAAAGHDIPLVLTQPDRPSGRGLKLTASAVSQAAAALGLRTEKPETLKDDAARELLRSLDAEVMVVAAYGLILPKAILSIPRRGCINIHASLLPRWRGAAPIQRAILAGDVHTGVAIMQMEEGLDTGPVLLEREIAIGPRDTTGSLTTKLARLGADAVVQALAHLDALQPRSQDPAQATYAAKIAKSEAALDWNEPCETLDRKVRAFDPAPGAQALVEGETVKIWVAHPVPGVQAAPGSVVGVEGEKLVIACGRGGLSLDVVQKPGGRKMTAAEFRRGKALGAGAH
jgi:methionyl-tRNA formyltransferase